MIAEPSGNRIATWLWGVIAPLLILLFIYPTLVSMNHILAIILIAVCGCVLAGYTSRSISKEGTAPIVVSVITAGMLAQILGPDPGGILYLGLTVISVIFGGHLARRLQDAKLKKLLNGEQKPLNSGVQSEGR